MDVLAAVGLGDPDRRRRRPVAEAQDLAGGRTDPRRSQPHRRDLNRLGRDRQVEEPRELVGDEHVAPRAGRPAREQTLVEPAPQPNPVGAQPVGAVEAAEGGHQRVNARLRFGGRRSRHAQPQLDAVAGLGGLRRGRQRGAVTWLSAALLLFGRTREHQIEEKVERPWEQRPEAEGCRPDSRQHVQAAARLALPTDVRLQDQLDYAARSGREGAEDADQGLGPGISKGVERIAVEPEA